MEANDQDAYDILVDLLSDDGVISFMQERLQRYVETCHRDTDINEKLESIRIDDPKVVELLKSFLENVITY